MDKSLRPTCVVCLEVPLTVTFTVVNEADSLLWTGCYSESEHSEEYKSSSGSLVGEHSLEHNNMHESIGLPVADCEDTVHDVDETTDFHPFEIAAKRETRHNKRLDHTQIQNCRFNTEKIVYTDALAMNGHDPRCEIDGHILVPDEHHRGDILVNGLPCNGQDISLDKLNLLSGIVLFPAASRSLPKSGLSISRKPYGETNTVSTDLLTFPRGIPVTAETSAIHNELGISKTEAELGQNGGNAESSLNRISNAIDEEIRDLSIDNLREKACVIATSRTRDGVKKDEKNHLDPGYFTEEGNEGSKDDLHTNDCVVPGDASSKTGCDVTMAASPDNGFHDESRGTAARKDGVRPKFGILKHSKTSASFDLHTEHLPISLRENWTDCYHMLSSNAMPSKTVAFCEQQLPKQKWDFAGDTSGAMDRLRAITSHLCLPVVVSGLQSDGLKEHHSHQKANQIWRYKHVGTDKDAPLADDPQQNLTLTFPEINDFITGIEKELFQMKKSDEMIASQLLALYTEIRQYKYTCNCQLYREMMETAIDNEDKKDELSRHHVDTIPERLCATLKQWGLTRINLQRRRFSIF